MAGEGFPPEAFTPEYYDEHILRNPGYLVLGALYEVVSDKNPSPNYPTIACEVYQSAETISKRIKGLEINRVSDALEALTGVGLALKEAGDTGPSYTITYDGLALYKELHKTVEETNRRLIELAKESEDLRKKLMGINDIFDKFELY